MEWRNSILNYVFIIFIILSGIILFISLREQEINLPLVVTSSVFILAFIISLLIYNKSGLSPEMKYVIQFDEVFISCYHSKKGTETVKWDEIREISIITTDKGPDQPSIWISLNADAENCTFPIGAKDSRGAVEKILGREGCDLKKWGEAMKATGNKKVSVWKRK